jgi:putative transposase
MTAALRSMNAIGAGSDGFEIGCGNGESVRIAFVLDCCDREAWELPRDPTVLSSRIGLAGSTACRLPSNGPETAAATLLHCRQYARSSARDIGLAPRTTPRPSPCPSFPGYNKGVVGTFKN